VTPLDVALLLLRVTIGAIYAAHGLRKLGWRNPDGFTGFRASIARRGYRSPSMWAIAAVGAEVGGGLLAMAGALTPFAAALLMAQSVTIVALVWRRGLWVEVMGVEYPFLLGVSAFAIGLVGPGSLSVDAQLGLITPAEVFVALAGVTVAGSIVGLVTRRPSPVAAVTTSDPPSGPSASGVG
jgi:putative oxidoreductase